MSIATDHRNSECVWMEFLDICRSALAAESNSPKCLPVMSPLTCMSTLGARNPRITGPCRVVGMCRFFVLAASIKEKKLDSQIRQRGSAIHICFCGVLTSLWWGLCTGWGVGTPGFRGFLDQPQSKEAAFFSILCRICPGLKSQWMA